MEQIMIIKKCVRKILGRVEDFGKIHKIRFSSLITSRKMDIFEFGKSE